MKVGDLVRTKHQSWMHDDYDDTDFGFIVKIGLIVKIDEQGVYVRHNGGLACNEGIRLFYHFEIDRDLEVVYESR